MKRELKFRVWSFIDKAMRSHEWLSAANVVYGALTSTNRVDIHVMQYTGLKDKNGVEIYEGDIIKADNSKHKCKVSWSEKYASFVLAREDWVFRHYFGEACDPEDCKVIGNIYENHELLKP